MNDRQADSYASFFESPRFVDPTGKGIWVRGCRKADIVRAGIPVLRSAQDWGNWEFLIPKEQGRAYIEERIAAQRREE